MKHVAAGTAVALFAWLAAGAADDERNWFSPEPVPDGRTAVLERADELDCARCHAHIVDEWKSTLHALAWVDELYQDELQGRRRKRGCTGCHAPEPLFAAEPGRKPGTREEDRHFGVTCTTCHAAADGAIRGPFGAANDAHASVRDELFVGSASNALCASCHSTNIGPVIGVAKDFAETDQAGRGRSCVGCHMAPLERATTAGPDAPAAELAPLRSGRSHALQTPRDPRFLRTAFEIELTPIERGVRVVISNAAGHRVPGLIGRTLRFEARALDGDGETLAREELEVDHRAYLPADDSIELVLRADAARVQLIGEHGDPRLKEPVPFLDETYEL